MANLIEGIERLTGVEGLRACGFLGFASQILFPASTHEFLYGGRNLNMNEHDAKIKTALIIDTASIVASAIIAYRSKGGIREFIHSKAKMNMGIHLVIAALSKTEVDKKQKFC